MPALGEHDNGGQTGFSVLIGSYLSLIGVILSEKSFRIIDRLKKND